MAKVEQTTERRKHGRLQLHGGAFATISPHPRVAGQILNISEAGLSFCYIGTGDHLTAASNVNILFNDGSFRLHNLPIKPVWDHAIPDGFSSGLISTRHCAVRFGDLTDKQRSDLKIFFQDHTPS